MPHPDLPDLPDATELAARVRRGDASPSELTEAAIARLEKRNAELGAVISPQYERAREQAAGPLPEGPLRGVPILLKDLGAHLAGDPCFNGMRALRDAGWTEPGETHFAGNLRRAGAVVLGRTNTPELGLLPTTEPAAFPPSRNPWDTGRSSGGSSGGSAAAVAAGLVCAAHASDGGGSIRIPAAHCGLVGLKPSRGRNSFGPDLGERWSGFSAEGFVTHSVRDTALFLDVTCGPFPGDPCVAPPPARPYVEEAARDPGRLRIGVMPRGPRGIEIHADCRDAALETARLLEGLGHRVEEAHPEALDDPQAPAGYVGVVTSNVAFALTRWGEKLGRPLGEDDVEPLTWSLAEIGRKKSAQELLAIVDGNHALARRMAAWWAPASEGGGGFDLLLTPTTGEPAPPLGEFGPRDGNPLAGFLRAAIFGAYTASFNVTGQPAISLPVVQGARSGLPVGSHLVAAYGREDLLLRVAAQLEREARWSERRCGDVP